jgi:pyruvate formate lyase activating enzyme
MVGRRIGAQALAAEIARDRVFFDESGGGVTFSGGEPMAQPDFLLEMLDRCGAQGIHRAVDTSGYAPRATLLAVAARTDLFLFDLKLMDDALHREHAGVGNDGILGNLRALSETAVRVEIRVPVIPSITDAGSVAATGAFLASLPRRLPVRLLPYHRAAMHKYERFGMPQRLTDLPEPTADDLGKLAEQLRIDGLEVRYE